MFHGVVRLTDSYRVAQPFWVGENGRQEKMKVLRAVNSFISRVRIHRISMAGKETVWGYLFILPWIIGLAIFLAGPILAAFYFGFTKYDILSSPVWIGLGNYHQILTDDPLFWKSLYNTVYFVGLSVSLRMIIGFILALLLNAKIRGIVVLRACYYLPVVVPIVATSILWSWILQPQFGVINYFMEMAKLPRIQWIVSEAWSKPSIVLVSLWRLGETMIIFLAGLQAIPRQLYEAAEVDGTSQWSKLTKITIPMLTPTIFFNLVIAIINSFQVFSVAYIITGGGPLNSTLFYMLYIFRQGFEYFHMGYASALAVILFLIIVILTILVVKSAKSWVYYEAERR